LAAGGSRRLGRPKQLLPYGEATLLDHTLATARECGFDQLLVALGGSAVEVRERVDLSGAQVVVNEAFGEGCSSSIAAAMDALDPRANVLVLLLGDQPGVSQALRERIPDAETLVRLLDGSDYLADEGLATALFIALRLPQPLLLEGEAGVGKTEAAKALARALGTPLVRLQCYEGIDA